MKVLYHLPVLPPKIPQAEALSQEIEMLCKAFEGRLIFLNPNAHSPIRIPRFLFGFQKLAELRRLEERFDLHHIFNPEPFAYPVLRWLRKPVVYSVTGSVGSQRPNVNFFNSLGAVSTLDEAALQQLQTWGLANVHLVQSGIDSERFTHTALQMDENTKEIRLLMASAPWTRDQFASKGIDALLDAAQQDPRIHLTLLWRGVLGDEIQRRVQALNLQQQVKIIDQYVDVNKLLAKSHAAILLAQTANIVKAFPHSLLDSLAAGKPVLISRAIPMARYVERTGCGVVVETVSAEAILAAVETLWTNYQQSQSVALAHGKADFSQSAMIASYQVVYEKALQHGMGLGDAKSVG